MLDKEFPIPLDDELTRIATLSILVGSLFVRLADWVTLGWVVVALGLVTLWLAHQIAIAPCVEEPARYSEFINHS